MRAVLGLLLLALVPACGEPAPDAAREACDDPDSLALVFTGSASEEGGDVYGRTVDGVERRLTDDGGASAPALSPDGRRVVFASVGDDGSVSDTSGPSRLELQVMDADGTHRRQLTTGDADRWPAWSPDGRTIAFVRQVDGDVEAVEGSAVPLVDADGSDVRPVRKGRGQVDGDWAPAWSPDGKRLAIVTGARGDEQSLVVVDVGTGREEQLLDGQFIGAPAWSPDGATIAVTTFGGTEVAPYGYYQVTVVDAETGEAEVVASPGASPSWSPDGQRLYLYAQAPAVQDYSGAWRVTELEVGAGPGRAVPGTREVGFLYGGYRVSAAGCAFPGSGALTGPDDVEAAETVTNPVTGESVQVMPRRRAEERALAQRRQERSDVPRLESKLVTFEELRRLEDEDYGFPEQFGEHRLLWVVATEMHPFGDIYRFDAATGQLISSGSGVGEPWPSWWDAAPDLSSS